MLDTAYRHSSAEPATTSSAALSTDVASASRQAGIERSKVRRSNPRLCEVRILYHGCLNHWSSSLRGLVLIAMSGPLHTAVNCGRTVASAIHRLV